MKNTFPPALTVLLIGVGCSHMTLAADDTTPMIHHAAAAVTVDGALDDAVWKAAADIRVDYINDKTGVLSDTPRMTVKYAWDAQYLYIGYETFDTNITVISRKTEQGPDGNKRKGCEIWSNTVKVDVVEFFIVFENTHLFWELHHNATNNFNDVLCVVGLPGWEKSKPSYAQWGMYFAEGEYLKDDGPNTFKSATRLKPKKNGKPSTVHRQRRQ